MSGEYDNTNRGALFLNDKQGNDKRPDMKGPLNVDGAEYVVSAWARRTKAGDKMLSLRIEPKRAPAASRQPEPPVGPLNPPPTATATDDTDGLPF